MNLYLNLILTLIRSFILNLICCVWSWLDADFELELDSSLDLMFDHEFEIDSLSDSKLDLN